MTALKLLITYSNSNEVTQTNYSSATTKTTLSVVVSKSVIATSEGGAIARALI